MFEVKESIDAKTAGTGSGVGKNIIPQAGDILPFAGTTAPAGWAICDGSNGTPDLRGDFVVGAANTANIGVTTGGNHEHTYDFGTSVTFATSVSTHPQSTTNTTGVADLPAHAHNRNFSMGTNAYAGTNYVTSNAGTVSRCLRSGHSHNAWNVNQGSNNSTDAHSHSASFNTRNTSFTEHTHLMSNANGTSGTTSGFTGNLVPYMILNYIMKL